MLDRLIQQAVMRVLQRSWDHTFSESSYGFRPGRSAHQVVARAQQHIAAGHRWVVDLDLEKFFDRVNHDKLMSQVARRIADKRLLAPDSELAQGGCVGERTRGTDGGRYTARWTSFPATVESCSRPTRPRAGATRASFCTVCGRLQHLCPQPASGPAPNGRTHKTPRRQTQAEGEPGEKCCSTTVGVEVPRVQFYEWDSAEAPNRAQSNVPFPSSNPSPHSANPRHQSRKDGSRGGPLPSVLAGLIWVLPNPDRAGPFQ